MVKTQIVELANEDIGFALPVKLEKSFSIDKATAMAPEVFGSLDLTTGKYFWGYASVDITDTEGDRITIRALEKVKDDLTIAPYNKIFLSHNYQDIAVGKIVATSMDSKGLLILAKLNEDHVRAKETWSSLQNGFLDAFSIGGKFLTVERIWNEDTETFNNVATAIEAMEVSLTSIPANPSAMLLGAFEKARKFIKLLNGKETLINEDNLRIPEKMVDDIKTEITEEVVVNDEVVEDKEETVEEVKTEEVVEAVEETKAEEVVEEKKDNDSVEENTDTKIPEEKVEEVKTEEVIEEPKEKEEPNIEEKEIEKTEDKVEEKEQNEKEEESDDLIDTKKTIEALTKKNTELLAENEKLKEEVESKSKDEKGDEAADAVTEEDSSVTTKEDKELEKTSEPMRKSIVLTEDMSKPKDKASTPIMDMLRR